MPLAGVLGGAAGTSCLFLHVVDSHHELHKFCLFNLQALLSCWMLAMPFAGL